MLPPPSGMRLISRSHKSGYMQRMNIRNGILCLASCLILLSGCSNDTQSGNSHQGMPPTRVVLIEAPKMEVAEKQSFNGDIAANEQVEIKSEVEGVISKIAFQEGQFVQSGQLLMQLDDIKLKEFLAEAEANFEVALANFKRSRELFSNNLISQQEYDQTFSQFQLNEASVRLNQRRLKDTRILAPFSGIIGQRHVSPGQVISKNTSLTWLIDLDPVKVEISIPERFLSRMQLNQSIVIRVVAYPEKAFEGKVFFISPFVELDTRTLLIKAEIPNPDQLLKPGMFAELDLTLVVRNDSIVIPEAAIFRLLENNRALVYVADEQNQAQLKTVELGARLPGLVEIRKGITENQKVIIEGTQKIGPGSAVISAPPERILPYRAYYEQYTRTIDQAPVGK